MYLDDVIIFSSTFANYLLRLEWVLHAIRNARLMLKHLKHQFTYGQLKFLGHIISVTNLHLYGR